MDFSDNPELMAIFREEVGERAAELAAATRRMADRSLSPDEAITARRNAHTIKGNSYVMGFHQMGDAAKVMEDTLKEVVSESRAQQETLGMLLAAVADLFPKAIEVGVEEVFPELRTAEQRLTSYLEGGGEPPDSDESSEDEPRPVAEIVDLADKRADRATAETETADQSDLGGLVSTIVTSFAAHATRVPTAQLYQLINRAVEVRLDMEVVLGALQSVIANPDDRLGWERALSTLEQSVVRLQTDALDLATISMSEITGTLDQLVKYIARRTGKDVKFEVLGDSVKVDRQVVDALRDPLRHLVVNALDHGIESTSERVRSGKPATATVKVEFAIDHHVLHMIVSDDGRGVDWGRVQTIADAAGFGLQDSTPEELSPVLFLSDFSTVDPPEEISGDGAGLAAVHEAAKVLHGSANVRSDASGTVVSLVVPRSLILQDLWIVEADGQQWGIPEAAVVAAMPAPKVVGDEVAFRGAPLIVSRLASIVGSSSSSDPHQLVVLGSPEGQIGLLVDDIVGRRQVAVKSLGPILDGAPYLAAAAHLGGDEVVVVIDPRQIIDAGQSEKTSDVYRPKVLVVDDSRGVRQLISATLGMNGFDVTVAENTREALGLLDRQQFDALVVDFHMPGRDGIELVRNVRSAHARLPIVMVSGVAAPDDQQRAADEGVDAYIDKADFRQGVLATTLWKLLGAAHPAEVVR